MVTELLEQWGEPAILATGGLVIGLAFGLMAQRSRFCFRAAAIDAGRGRLGLVSGDRLHHLHVSRRSG